MKEENKACTECGDEINEGVMFGNGEVNCYECYERRTKELKSAEFPR